MKYKLHNLLLVFEDRPKDVAIFQKFNAFFLWNFFKQNLASIELSFKWKDFKGAAVVYSFELGWPDNIIEIRKLLLHNHYESGGSLRRHNKPKSNATILKSNIRFKDN